MSKFVKPAWVEAVLAVLSRDYYTVPCKAAIQFMSRYEAPIDAWDACERPMWLMWLLMKTQRPYVIVNLPAYTQFLDRFTHYRDFYGYVYGYVRLHDERPDIAACDFIRKHFPMPIVREDNPSYT